MIALTKTAKPAILTKKYDEWTNAIKTRIAANQQPTDTEKGRYTHADIKAALLTETAGKCAYCESKFEHIAYGDVEHVTPKSSDPEEWFRWENLTLACDICNTNKGVVEVMDPYGANPEQRLIFFGATVWALPGDHEAFLSVRQLKLNREKLHGRRFEKIETLMTLLDNIATCPNAQKKAVLKADFEAELDSRKEYAALARSIWREAKQRGTV